MNNKIILKQIKGVSCVGMHIIEKKKNGGRMYRAS